MKTDRSVLRRLHSQDLENIQKLESNENVMRYTSVGRALSTEESLERLARWIARDDGEFGIWVAEKPDGDFIGWFMLKPNEDESVELGFMILQELWGQGLTTEIAARLMEHAGARVVVARVDPANSASLKVLEKLSFRVVKTEGGTVHLTSAREALTKSRED